MNNLNFVAQMIDEEQFKYGGDFNALFSSNVVKALKEAGYVYDPEVVGEDSDNGDVFEIVATVEQEMEGTFTATLCRKIAKTLIHEGVRKA